ncbi:MAG TPA: tetratricopeptide repeat protein [Persephonella sp.]|uniref:Tetratricopeptide repeat domain protein n=1 Tax=Persephonella marina (strain DSM 14350 / EX-H1) TaxID=123214 RepID=C0QUF0_PERMH|nr:MULTISPECIES: tetratricopeptide repeat protein [Persephonella]ACO04232.1 tetratricopeptide repeat domain protein [Persephonella marina EX-H1]HCB70066.1 tetratricopeptide repeat protein [Persephonella sp.]
MSDRIDMLKKALEKDPENPLGLYGLGMEYMKMGNFEDAIVYLKKYLSVYDDQGAGYRALAQCYVKLGDIEKAIEAYERGIEQAKKYKHASMEKEFSQEIEILKGKIGKN